MQTIVVLALVLACCLALPVNTVTSQEAYSFLVEHPQKYFLIDVRTAAEWEFVGVPSLPNNSKPIFVEYLTYPSWSKNSNFLNGTISALKESPSFDLSTSQVIFMCKTGGRSIRGATEFANAYPMLQVLNIDHGFQGDLNTKDSHRNELNGWVASNLPYTQN